MSAGAPERGRRLFWQVYLHGALLLLLIAASLGIAGFVLGRPPGQVAYAKWLSAYLEARAPDIEGNPTRLASDLERERELVGSLVTVYRLDNTLVASNANPPLAPLDPGQVARLGMRPSRHPRYHLGAAVPVVAGGRTIAYAVVLPQRLMPHLLHVAAVLLAVLVVLALGSIPLARAIASPLEQLTQAAERLGAGDLGARSGLRRRGEVGALAVAFDDMAERLERLVRGEKELLANVSHELRTPLARIRVAVELAAEGDEARARAALAEIGSDLVELDRLVEDVLTAARLDLATGRSGSGAPPLRRAPVDARALIEESAARFRSLHPERVLEVSLDDPLPVLVADAALLRRALDNLLDNARKYSGAGQPVQVAARASGTSLAIMVRDHGIGIAADDLAHVGEPFFRTARSRESGTAGLGLGLVLARRIVESHGGTLVIDSRPNEGTMVTVTI